MKLHLNVAASVAALSFLAVTSLAAQSEDASKREAQLGAAPAFHYLKASDIVGSKIYASAVSDLQKNQKSMGEVKDLVIDTNVQSGHGSFAVSNDGELFTLGHERMPGVSCLKWDVKTRRFALECPATDAASAVGTGEAKVEMHAKKSEDAVVGMGQARNPSRLLMLSGIKGLKVYPEGSKDSYGKIDDLWIDTHKGNAAYFVVSSGGVLGMGDTTRLVPWSAMTVEHPVDAQNNQITVRASKEVLDSAPKIDTKTEPNEPTLRAAACKVFGCEEPGQSTWVKKAHATTDGIKQSNDTDKR